MGTCLLEPMFGAAKTVAVDDADSVSWQELRGFGSHDPLKGAELPDTVSDKFGGNIRFETIEFVVHRFERNVDVVLMSLKGMMNGGRGFEYDFEHQGHERRKQESTLILFFCGLVEELVEFGGRKQTLQRATDEDGEGRCVLELCENLDVGDQGDSFQMDGRKTGERIEKLCKYRKTR